MLRLTKAFKIESGRNRGNFLSMDTATNYLSTIINIQSNKYKTIGSAEAKLFFTCLDSNARTESTTWLKALKSQMRRFICRCKDACEDMDQSATPVYLQHVKSMLKAYAKKGDKEAAESSFAIITAHQAAGRASEASLTPLGRLVVRSVDFK